MLGLLNVLLLTGSTFSVALHAGGGVDGVSEQAVARHGEADDACGARSGVQPDAQLQQRAWAVPDIEGARGSEQAQRHVGDLRGVAVSVWNWGARHTHVRVTDRLHLHVEKNQIMRLSSGM